LNDGVFDNRGFSVWSAAKSIGVLLLVLIALAPAFAIGGKLGGWIFASVVLVAGFWWRWRRRRELFARMPTSAIGNLAGGYVEVTGKVESAGTGELRDPIQNQHCLWFGVETQRLEGSRFRAWMPLRRATSSRPFVLRDATGSCLVDLRGAQLALQSAFEVGINDRCKHRIWRIAEGDQITIVGEAENRDGRWWIVRPAMRRFFVMSGAPGHADELLGDVTRGLRGSMLVLFAIAAVVLVVIAVLAGCARGRDVEEVDPAHRVDDAVVASVTAGYEAQLADTGRAQRWREEHQRWAEKKSAINGEPVAANPEHAAAPAPELIRGQEGNRRLVLNVAQLRHRGAIGDDGEVPAWLRVASFGPTLDVSNAGSEPLVVNVWRLFGRGSSLRLCEMIAHDAKSSSIPRPELAPGQKLNYRNDTPRPCHNGSDENLLAFEIRRGDELVWLTRSRLPELLGVRADEVDALLDTAIPRR